MLRHTVHHPQCEARSAAQDAARATWLALWPHACATCHGRGGFEFGDGTNPDSWMDCPTCRDNYQCPRCAGPLPPTHPDCPACRWSVRDASAALPPLDACLGECWDDSLAEA